MKTFTKILFTLTALSALCTSAFADNMDSHPSMQDNKHEMPKDNKRFKEHKAKLVTIMERSLTCVKAADSREAMQGCMREAKEQRESMRKEFKGGQRQGDNQPQ